MGQRPSQVGHISSGNTTRWDVFSSLTVDVTKPSLRRMDPWNLCMVSRETPIMAASFRLDKASTYCLYRSLCLCGSTLSETCLLKWKASGMTMFLYKRGGSTSMSALRPQKRQLNCCFNSGVVLLTKRSDEFHHSGPGSYHFDRVWWCETQIRCFFRQTMMANDGSNRSFSLSCHLTSADCKFV